MRLDGCLDIFQLLHKLLVNVQTARRVDKQHVVAMPARMFICRLRNGDRVALALLKHRNVELAADDLELVNGGRAIDVAGHQQRPAALTLFKIPCQLGDVRRFTRALQADKHDDRRRRVGHANAALPAAHQGTQLVVDDFDDLLRRRQAFQNILAHCLFADAGDKILDHAEVDVSLEQRHANLAHGCFNVALSQTPARTQVFEYFIEFFGQSFKCHQLSPISSRVSVRISPTAPAIS